MNFNFTVKCDACGEKTNCRVGASNRHEWCVSFACQDCGNIIDLNFNGKEEVVGGDKVMPHEPFDEETNFVDLHPDFPVSFEKYVMGNTPYVQAIRRQGIEKVMFHKQRTDYLNAQLLNLRPFQTLLKHYKRDKIKPFKLNLKKSFSIDVDTDLPQDINAGLYSLIAKVMSSFEFPFQSREDVELNLKVTHDIEKASPDKMRLFIDEMIDTGFLKRIQLDCIDIYPQILAADMPLRPALFLDFDDNYSHQPVALRVSNDDFETHKDLYKDIAETISKLLVLVAGINNLSKRQNHNAFKLEIGKRGKRDLTPKDLNSFADMAYGLKQDMIDDSWFEFIDKAIDNQLRNAIAHVKTEYDEVSQIITYYPKQEGTEAKKSQSMSFLEFMRRLLVSYREMHRLHHLVKALFYYRFLVQKKV